MSVDDLIEKLSNPSEEVRDNAAEKLVEIGEPAVPALIDALKNENNLVRGGAAEALGCICDASAVPELIETLKDEDKLVREVAAWALGIIGDASAVPLLIEALKDDDWNVREAAAEALGGIDNGPFVPALIEALKEEDANVRGGLRLALKMIGTPAIPALIEALNDVDMAVRYDAAEILGNLGDGSGITVLIGGLQDGDEELRGWAAEVLERLCDTSGASALVEVLGIGKCDNDNDEVLREIVESATPALVRALQDENQKVRWHAAEALEKIEEKNPGSVDLKEVQMTLGSFVHNSADKAAARKEAAGIYGKIREKVDKIGMEGEKLDVRLSEREKVSRRKKKWHN